MKSFSLLLTFGLSTVLANNFEFFTKPFYQGCKKTLNVSPDRCVNVGTFSSAKFNGDPADKVIMYTGPNCDGKRKERSLKDAYEPGDNIADYGTNFRSVKYIKGHSDQKCGCKSGRRG
ncbi:hypothetical protein BB559_006231 [Furculomyces boomerangus]|uniref:Pectate lyase n=1 Tax=Furculomyces boomerangus TaxID=61424 RepID=A0A2T9Y450_9FUNG|nr:hypothetical protein BB559_006372 [Furculomyces boomerangus]PVU87083.1 hypothetical protein BB559_006231 [Furculomyces boomerangus]